MFQRIHLQLLRKRISEPRRFIQVIIGPRQVGKTTLMKQLTKDITIPFQYISADESVSIGNTWLEQNWEAARIKFKNSGADTYLLIIDEVQKINGWSQKVKSLWDSDSFNNVNLKIILLGSACLLIEKGLTESLAGRFEVIKVNHWSFSEMEKAFNFSEEEFIWFGGYPGTADLIKDEPRWKEYVKNALIETTISKDILMLTRIDKPSLLKKIFELGVAYSSQILSYNKIMGQLTEAGNTTTISYYLKLLCDAGMICGLEKFYSEKHRQKASSPKFQVKNTAYISALSGKNFQFIQSEPQEWGRIVESAVGAHLLNYSEQGNYQLFYWRHVNDEIDFVMQKDKKLIGLEIKSGIAKPPAGMDSFKKRFNPDKVLLIGASGLSWKELLRMDPVNLF